MTPEPQTPDPAKRSNPAAKTPKAVKVLVRNLTKSFGSLLVLDNLNFVVYAGELLCLVGPTGCGKTTFLNCLTGFLPLTAGEILVDGQKASFKKGDLGFVFQESSTIPWLTVYDNVAFGLKIKKTPPEVIKERVERILTVVGLNPFKDLYPRELSASLDQRVALAREFATQPNLLLMDEPYGQLDIKLRYYLEDELRRIQEREGTTVAFVTHNIEEAVYLADRILVLTQKPATIKEEVIVTLPRPRRFDDPSFVAIRDQVTAAIQWW
ncbi:MAG: ABC transporter ATP-binding protein [Deltaproteobacteria bacterium]|jgi:sulfonate transport system ATP-binding protein|nr:ABC transporter ATP-binding protein [Deltaproteobacteria bacterium]